MKSFLNSKLVKLQFDGDFFLPFSGRAVLEPLSGSPSENRKKPKAKSKWI